MYDEGARQVTYSFLVVRVTGGLEGLPSLGRLHELKIFEDEPGFLLGHGAEGKEGGRKARSEIRYWSLIPRCHGKGEMIAL